MFRLRMVSWRREAVAVELAEMDGAGDGSQVPGCLSRHWCGVPCPLRQRLCVEQYGFDELAVVPAEQSCRAEDFQQQRCPPIPMITPRCSYMGSGIGWAG